MTDGLVVAADDRSGAFEVAARLADGGSGAVPVVPWDDETDAVSGGIETESSAVGGSVVVIDLASRYLEAAVAASRSATVDRWSAGRRAHKIDSTLRGNWPHELIARSHRSPVLLVPALPELGRVCQGGMVFDAGRPVHEGPAGRDVRGGPMSSRPADLLTASGAIDVIELSDATAVRTWCGRPTGIAVADAVDASDLDRIVAAWSMSDGVVLAGTSSVIGRIPGRSSTPVAPLRRPDGAVLVVCGSVHPIARRQIAVLERRGVAVTEAVDDRAFEALERTGVLALVTAIPGGDITASMAVAAASSLARGVATLVDGGKVGTMVILGGDTASAVLGPATVLVDGTVGPGTARATIDRPTGGRMLVVTRAGGFGDASSLDDLLRSTLSA